MQINNRKFKQRRVLTTHVKRKWTFAFLGSGFAEKYLANRLCPVRTKLNFVCFAKKKYVNRKPFLERTIFLTNQKVFSSVTKLQRCGPVDLEAYSFLSDKKILCSFTAMLHCVILVREHDQLRFL